MTSVETLPVANARHVHASPATRSQWAELLAGVFSVVSEGPPEGSAPGGCDVWTTGRSVLSRIEGMAWPLVRSEADVTVQRLDQITVSVVSGGGRRVETLGGAIDVAAGDVLVGDMMQPMTSNPLGGALGDVTLWIGRDRLHHTVVEDLRLHGTVLPAGSPSGRLVGGCLAQLAASAPQMTTRTMDHLVAGVTALIGDVLELAASERGGSAAAPFASFFTIAAYINRNLASPRLDADLLAASFGLSRSALYRLFEHVGGVAGFIRRRRLQKVHQEITTPAFADRGIAEIARRWSFRDIGAFGRAFRAVYGAGPSEVRDAALKRHELPSLVPEGQAEGLGPWLREAGLR